jgi:hypothetical protein
MKKLITALLTTAILLSAIPTPLAAATVRGDFNGDGVVTIADALTVLRYLAKLDNTINYGAAVAEEGKVTINDALEILKYLAKLSNAVSGVVGSMGAFSLALPLGWRESPFNAFTMPYMYQALNERGDTLTIANLPYEELFYEMNIGINFDVKGLTLTQIAERAGKSVNELTVTIYAAFIDEVTEDEDYAVSISAPAQIDGRDAMRLIIDDLNEGESAVYYLVLADTVMYALVGQGDNLSQVESILRTFRFR